MRDDEEENSYTIKEYAETLAYLEGNSIEWYHAETDREYGVFRQGKGGEKIITRLMDQAGKSFNSRGENEKAESYWERYERFGLMFHEPYKRVTAGEDAVRDLLKPRKHDFRGIWPRLHIARSCQELILEMKRLKYKATVRLSDERELKQTPVEARRHLCDCLRYLAISDASYIRSLES